MSNTILLIDDDVQLTRLIATFLDKNGFTVQIETNGQYAVEKINELQPALVIMDVVLPGLDGLSICRSARTFYHGPILFMTALNDAIDEVAGLEIGADDYLLKPVKPRVLLARIRALLRRCSESSSFATDLAQDRSCTNPSVNEPPPPPLKIGDLHINRSARSVTRRGKEIPFTNAEFDLLVLLAQQAGRPISRDEIYAELRGLTYDGLDRMVDLRISRLRKKLNDDPKQPTLIKSIRGTGYLLTV